MKKVVALALAAMMLLGAAVAVAEDLGVQLVGGSDDITETVSLDNMKLETTYTIDGYARVTPRVWQFTDRFYQFEKDHVGDFRDGGSEGNNPSNGYYYQYYKYINIMHSGENADFAWFEVDVTNLTKNDIDFTQEAEVMVIYDEDYEFVGWVRMINYDYDTSTSGGKLIRSTLDPANSETTPMMYTAHMIFGCTLPNAVVEGKEPLRIEINLGGNELIFHIRK